MTRDSGCIDLERTHLIVKTTVARYAKLLGRGGRPQNVRKRRPEIAIGASGGIDLVQLRNSRVRFRWPHHSTYEAAANRANWDRAALEWDGPERS